MLPSKNPKQRSSIGSRASADKPEQILAGAMQEFLEHGYACTSMDRVAAAAGVSKQTLYSHFQDKERLFAALVERIACEKLHNLFGEESLQGEPSIVLREVASKALSKLVNDDKHLCFLRLAIAESERFPHLAQLTIRSSFYPGVCKLSDYLASRSELKILDPEATARIFAGTLFSFILTMEVMHGKEVMPMESDRLIDCLVHLVIGRGGGTCSVKDSDKSSPP